MNTFTFDIKKPFGGNSGNYVYLRGDTLKQCIRNRAQVFVKIPSGTAEIDPIAWLAKGKMVKKVFLRPDNPMVLYGGVVPIKREVAETVEEVKEEPQKSLFDI